MKKILLLSSLLIGAFFANAQQATSCCQLTAQQTFNSYADEKAFLKKHPNPVPVNEPITQGEMVELRPADGKAAKAFLIKAQQPTTKYLFVIHEWWGLNDHIKQEAVKLSADLPDYNIIALDLYDGKIATERESAAKYMQSVSADRSVAIINAAIEMAGDGAQIATIGWCFGGGWSHQAALLAGSKAIGCIIYYGQPELNKEKLAAMQCDALMIWPTQDQWINAQVVEGFKEAMADAGKQLEVLAYDADHAFANPSNPKFNKEFGNDAYNHALEYLKSK